MLAQHVASELRMRSCTSSIENPIFTFKYNGFLSYNEYIGFMRFLPVFNMFEYEIGNVRIIIESQSGWRSNEDMKMSSVPSFGAPGSLIFVVVA